MMPVSTGKDVVIVPTFHPEQWELRLNDGDDEGWHEVSHADFDNYNVGDTYPGNKG